MAFILAGGRGERGVGEGVRGKRGSERGGGGGGGGREVYETAGLAVSLYLS